MVVYLHVFIHLYLTFYKIEICNIPIIRYIHIYYILPIYEIMEIPSPFDDTELQLAPEIYTPIRNDNGEFIDSYIRGYNFERGLRCNCGTNVLFVNKSNFATHTKTLRHKKWLEELSKTNINYHQLSQELNAIVEEQRQIIGRLENEKSALNIRITSLEKQLGIKNSVIARMTEQQMGIVEESMSEIMQID